jgi:hypothetical protein
MLASHLNSEMVVRVDFCKIEAVQCCSICCMGKATKGGMRTDSHEEQLPHRNPQQARSSTSKQHCSHLRSSLVCLECGGIVTFRTVENGGSFGHI